MPVLTLDVVDEVCRDLLQGGVRLRVLSVDYEANRVELDLELDDAECADCVMPTDYLERLISSRLLSHADLSVEVLLHDPRRSVERSTAPAAEHAVAEHAGAQQGATVTVLDPTAPGRGGDPDPGPDAGPLRGRTVLFRVDPLWRSWDWTVDEWSSELRAAGVTVRTWKRWQGIPGDEGERQQQEFEALVRSSDALVSGLANCGSCSAWTVRDALTGLDLGVATLTVATEHFVPLARILAEDGRRPGLRLLALPYPLDTRPEEEVREIARRSFGPFLDLLGASV